MKKNILGAFTLALLVLMGTGVAFGHWQDWVYVEGYVRTGNIDVVPSYEGSWYDEFNYKEYTGGKGVATQNVYVEGDTLYINLYNVYPALCWYGVFDIHNIGTVPAGFVNMTCSSSPELILDPIGPWTWNVFYRPPMVVDSAPPLVGPIANLTVTQCPNDTGPSTLCQIDPCDPVWFCVSICFMNPLPQNTTFTFELALEFWNWNEVPCQIPTTPND